MNTKIRQLTTADLPYIYDICVKTGDNGNDASSFFYDPYIIGQYYAVPYIFFEPDICFVALQEEHESKRPFGYIIGTSDSSAYYSWFYDTWIPQLQNMYPKELKVKSEQERRIISLFYEKNEAPEPGILQEYPAHLHIDLLKELQGKGAGKMLMNTFFTALQNKGCKGLHLGVSKQNEHAVGFYQKIGFSILDDSPYSLLLGLKF